jgi:signal transduction histidine kinase
MQSEKMLAGLLRALAEQSAKTLDRDLIFIEWQTASFAREHERLFLGGDHRLSGEQPEFREAPGGSGCLYQTNLKEGSSFFVPKSSVSEMGEEERRLAVSSASLNALYRNAVESTPHVVAAYLNTNEPADMNRYYPFIERPWEVYPAELDMGEFNFFYLADAKHNPGRKTVWTGVYLDPAGKGWMLSCIAPVYAGNTLKGVVGLDVTFSEMVKGIRGLSLEETAVPREGTQGVLVAPDGMVLAATDLARVAFGLPDLPVHDYSSSPVAAERVDPRELRLDGIADAIIRDRLQSFLTSKEVFLEIPSAEGPLMLAQSAVASTGWRLCLVVKRSELLAEFDRLAGLQSELEAKATELAYSRWLFSLASGYLHNVGNAATRLGLPLADLNLMLERSSQYPEVFEIIGKGGEKAKETLKFFEEVLVGEVVTTLREAVDSIRETQEAIRFSIRHQQDSFRSAVRQASEQIDLSTLLGNMCDLFRRHKATIEEQIAPKVTVQSFRIPLWQGLDNLIRNAIRASKAMQPIIVSCEPTENGAKVVVADKGHGIAPENLSKVMNAGFTTKNQTGTGLGLHSFAVFLSATGGDLRVESDGIGRGATVVAEIHNAE